MSRIGQILIASPKMPDPFFRTLVLILKDDAEAGAMGIVLNRPQKETLQFVWQQMGVQDVPDSLASNFLHWGGPVYGPLVALHRCKEFAEDVVVDESQGIGGLYCCAETDKLHAAVKTEEFRVFTGYAGWGKGQLDYELRAGAWFLVPYQHCYLFNNEPYETWALAKRHWGELILNTIGLSPQMAGASSYN